MALLLMDGFDCYADIAEFRESPWTTHGGESGLTINTTGGVNGGGCMSLSSISNYGFHRALSYGYSYSETDVPSQTYTFQAWVYIDTFGGSPDIALQFLTGIDEIAQVYFNQTGQVQVSTFNHTTVTNHGYNDAFTVDTWHFLEFQILTSSTSATADGTYEIRVDGTTIDSGSSLNIHYGTSIVQPMDAIRLTGGDQSLVYWDDVVVMDGTGADANLNDFTGARYIDTINVEADGGTVDWTRNSGTNDWEMVDDTANAADDDTTYVSSNTVAQETRFNLAAPSNTDDEVHALQIRARLKKSDAGDRTVRGLINVAAGTEETTYHTFGPTTEYLWYDLGVRETNDTGGTAWDVAEVTNTEIGIEIVS